MNSNTATPYAQQDQPEFDEPLPKCCCCDVKTGLYIYLGLSVVATVVNAIRGGSGWLGLILLFLNIFAVYKESPVMLKVFAALNIIGMVLTDVFLGILLVALNKNPSAITNNPNIPASSVPQDPKAVTDTITYVLIGSVVLQNILTIVVVIHMRMFWQYIEKRNAKAIPTVI